MVGTFAAALLVTGASVALGRAALALCGARRWSWAAPGVGLGLLLALCWGTVRLPGGGATAALAVAALAVASLAAGRGRAAGGGEALRRGVPVALAALAVASLPFWVEGHFGVLGTGLNPDMSQHLLAAERLAQGHASQLEAQGYPLGPHAAVVALREGLGIGPVQGFSGLTLALAALAALCSLGWLGRLAAPARVGAALLVALPYAVASYLAQGAFKELAMALFLLAFVLCLREADRAWAGRSTRLLPAALLAAGALYAYSFPALMWLGAAGALWAVGPGARERLRGAGRAALAFAVLVAPELGRMDDFRRFETFDPDGPGLGNLFGQLSPLEALGIWPSGDFRLAPGDGAVPAVAFYAGAALALALLALGARRCARAGERALLAGLGAAALAYLAARLGGTAYTAAKAIEVAAPLATLTIIAPLFARTPLATPTGAVEVGAVERDEPQPRGVERVALALFGLAAGACSLLALVNAPVGPTTYSPALAEMRTLVSGDPTLVLAPLRLLDEQHGLRYLAWELRGGRVCIAAESAAGEAPPRGVRFVIAPEGAGPPYPGLRLRRAAPPYALWEVPGPHAPRSPCPLIEVRQERQRSP